MALTALLFSTPGYRPVFPSANPAGRADSPGVRNLQVWMQQAWDSGQSWTSSMRFALEKKA
jgi:hypothetical protein